MSIIEILGGLMGLAGIVLFTVLGAALVEAILGSASTYWWATGLLIGGSVLAVIGGSE